jgi:hypothetical protein
VRKRASPQPSWAPRVVEQHSHHSGAARFGSWLVHLILASTVRQVHCHVRRKIPQKAVLRDPLFRLSLVITSSFVPKANNVLLTSGGTPPFTLTPPSPRQLFAFRVNSPFSPNMAAPPGFPGPPPSPQFLAETRISLLLGSQTVFLSLALLFYGLRIYSRSRPAPHFMLDDLLITIAIVRVQKHLHWSH